MVAPVVLADVVGAEPDAAPEEGDSVANGSVVVVVMKCPAMFLFLSKKSGKCP